MPESQQNDIPIILANSRCIRAFLGLLEIIHFKDQKKKSYIDFNFPMSTASSLISLFWLK